jgi:hypothetical protein
MRLDSIRDGGGVRSDSDLTLSSPWHSVPGEEVVSISISSQV